MGKCMGRKPDEMQETLNAKVERIGICGTAVALCFVMLTLVGFADKNADRNWTATAPAGSWRKGSVCGSGH